MLRVKLLHAEAVPPTVAHPGEDLGYDLYAAEALVIPSGAMGQIKTGIAVEIFGPGGEPMGAVVRDRSSMALRRLVVTAGVIDAGYRGELKILMENFGPQEARINAGDKIANLLPYPVLTGAVEVAAELGASVRKDGGFGSSGK